MNNKPFKTLDEQVELLKNRNLRFRNEDIAKHILMNNSYYGIVNSYKDLFCGKSFDNTDDYRGQYFEDLLAIYDFDKELSAIVYKYLIMIETTFKTSMSYYISDVVGDKEDVYLNKINYNNGYRITTGSFQGKFSIEKTFSKINEQLANPKAKSIVHYKKKHGNVPPWILMHSLSLGVLYEWYGLCKPEIKNNISTVFLYKNTDIHLKKELFQKSIKIIHLYRNCVAHGSRLIMHEIPEQKRLPERLIKQYCPKRDMKFYYSKNRTFRFFSLLTSICVLFSNRDTIRNNFIFEIDYLFSKLQKENNELYNILLYRSYIPMNFIDLLKLI